MVRDIRLMKQSNINAVRTSHYPNVPRWYRALRPLRAVCDRRGEHRVRTAWATAPTRWQEPRLDGSPPRPHPTHVERDKNHPSIVMWSLATRRATASTSPPRQLGVRRRDPSRPIHYERALLGPNTDVICPMYSPPRLLSEYGSKPQTRPFILCEYAHAMGNSTGDLWSYWRPIYKYPQLQGGLHLGLERPGDPYAGARHKVAKTDTEETRPDRKGHFFAYGGDFGPPDTPSDDNFCMNGLVDADRVPHPGLYQVKKVQQSIQVKPVDLAAGKVEIANIYDFVSTDFLECRWELMADGQRVDCGLLEHARHRPR